MKNAFGIEYMIQSVRTGRRHYFPSKRKALENAKQYNEGDWEVFRIWWNGHKQKIKTVGGHFDDWPDFPEEDY